MKILLATIALLIGSAAFAQSAPVVIGNGAYLLQACQIQARVDSGTQTNGTANDFIAAGYCMGMVKGVRDVAAWTNSASVPLSITNREVAAVVVKFLLANPQRLGEADTTLTLAALKQTYGGTR